MGLENDRNLGSEESNGNNQDKNVEPPKNPLVVRFKRPDQGPQGPEILVEAQVFSGSYPEFREAMTANGLIENRKEEGFGDFFPVASLDVPGGIRDTEISFPDFPLSRHAMQYSTGCGAYLVLREPMEGGERLTLITVRRNSYLVSSQRMIYVEQRKQSDIG